jgi:hypothetical protein
MKSMAACLIGRQHERIVNWRNIAITLAITVRKVEFRLLHLKRISSHFCQISSLCSLSLHPFI